MFIHSGWIALVFHMSAWKLYTVLESLQYFHKIRTKLATIWKRGPLVRHYRFPLLRVNSPSCCYRPLLRWYHIEIDKGRAVEFVVEPLEPGERQLPMPKSWDLINRPQRGNHSIHFQHRRDSWPHISTVAFRWMSPTAALRLCWTSATVISTIHGITWKTQPSEPSSTSHISL